MMELKIPEWKEFRLDRLMVVRNGKGITDDEICDNPGDLQAIQGGENNNGVLGFIDENYCRKQGYVVIDKPCLTVARVGTAGFVSFHNSCVVGDKAKALLFQDCNNKSMEQYLFMASILNQNRYKYNYGRGLVTEVYMRESIRLPVQHDVFGQPLIDPSKKYSDDGYVPDWDFMEQYMKSLNTQPLVTQRGGSASPTLGVERWKAFRLDRLFVLKGGFYNKKPEHSVAGHIPFLGSTENDNGATEFYSLDDIRAWNKVGLPDDSLNGKLFDGGCIAVTVNGSVCNAFYQAEQFTCSHDITALYVPDMFMTESVGLFIASVIMKDKYRWSYGRKPHSIEKFGKSFLSLPILYDTSGHPVIDPLKKYSDDGYIPDWSFMEQYIESLPGSDLLK